jgi:hypothetical protein
MLKRAVGTEESVAPEPEAMPVRGRGLSDGETDNGAALESLWTPVALSLALKERESDG